MEDANSYRDAKRKVEVKLGFYIHLIAYVLVNAALTTVNLVTNPEHLWFQWPLIGWGAGLLLHAGIVLASGKGHSFKERMIAREMHKRR